MMADPLVSVCVPNLNTRPYLQERVDTIFGQTYSNWEMVVSDNYSDDGAWEFFEKLARQDRRVSIEQAPKQGLYANWNNTIRRARGEYVYIATSDDTMAADCLEKLVAALEQHRDCGLAHCSLVMIDGAGSTLKEPTSRWPECTVFVKGVEGWENKRHLRIAPHDGLLHLIGRSVYQSITELLIRRSLFSQTGMFNGRWGSIGDLNWDMKAGLVTNTVHVPDTWASFRVHATQATSAVDTTSAEYARKLQEMFEDAISTCQSHLPLEVREGLAKHWVGWSHDMLAYYKGLRDRRRLLERRVFQAGQVLNGSAAARNEVIQRLFGVPKWDDRAPDEMRSWLKSLGITPLVPVPS